MAHPNISVRIVPGARESSIRVRVNASEEAALTRIGQRMAKDRSGIRQHDGSINVSKVIRTLIAEEDARHE